MLKYIIKHKNNRRKRGRRGRMIGRIGNIIGEGIRIKKIIIIIILRFLRKMLRKWGLVLDLEDLLSSKTIKSRLMVEMTMARDK